MIQVSTKTNDRQKQQESYINYVNIQSAYF